VWQLAGWRWLFILEGTPAILLGIITVFYLTDWPSQARCLRQAERWYCGFQLCRLVRKCLLSHWAKGPRPLEPKLAGRSPTVRTRRLHRLACP
jgi:MFS transporter, ACS family, tartrate transporter